MPLLGCPGQAGSVNASKDVFARKGSGLEGMAMWGGPRGRLLPAWVSWEGGELNSIRTCGTNAALRKPSGRALVIRSPALLVTKEI